MMRALSVIAYRRNEVETNMTTHATKQTYAHAVSSAGASVRAFVCTWRGVVSSAVENGAYGMPTTLIDVQGGIGSSG